MDRLHPELLRVVHRGKGIFVAWTRVSRRSEELSRRLGFEYYRLERLDRPTFLKPFKNLVNACRTLVKVLRSGPSVIFAFQAHPFVTLSSMIYKLVSGCKVVPDLHTAAYTDYHFFPVNYLNGILWRTADFVIVHNQHSLHLLKRKYHLPDRQMLVLEDPIPDLPETSQHVPGNRDDAEITGVLVSRFSEDEPVKSFLDASIEHPSIHFYITGDYRKAPFPLDAYEGRNISFTGFLPESEYVSLLRSADFLVVLTTRENTLLSGGYEGLSLGKPMIVSDTDTLRDYFGDSTVYAENTPEGISGAVRVIFGNLAFYRERSEEIRRVKSREWDRKFSELFRLL